MKIACVKALADLTHAESSDVVSNAYGGEIHRFGADYIIPKPFDPRLSVVLPHAVAQAAMETGVATRTIEDLGAYKHKLQSFIYRSSMVMRPVISQAKADLMRVTFGEGEDERVLRAVQTILDDQICIPILVGRPSVIESRIERLGLRMKAGIDFEIIDPNNDSRYQTYWRAYHQLMERKGVSPEAANSTSEQTQH